MIPNNYFAGGVAVITGGGSGLGAAMATRFADQRIPVALLDIDYEQAKQTAEKINTAGGNARARDRST